MFLSFILMNMENFCKGKVQRFPGPWGVPSLATERKLCSNEELGIRNEGGGFAEIDEEVAAVLAFVISHTTFLAAQDDETGRCPKVS